MDVVKSNNWYSTRQRMIVLEFESDADANEWDREAAPTICVQLADNRHVTSVSLSRPGLHCDE